MGAWIETEFGKTTQRPHYVAPYVGAWIETKTDLLPYFNDRSHPTWVRGLKPTDNIVPFIGDVIGDGVAPYVGAWIETGINNAVQNLIGGRTLRGCVD